jgi:hypothetical protein
LAPANVTVDFSFAKLFFRISHFGQIALSSFLPFTIH